MNQKLRLTIIPDPDRTDRWELRREDATLQAVVERHAQRYSITCLSLEEEFEADNLLDALSKCIGNRAEVYNIVGTKVYG